MQLHYSTTSPYVRVARIALAEKGLADQVEGTLADPWADDPGLLAANPSARVPALRLASGLPLTESLLIVLWLETQRPQPTLLGSEPDRVISQAGIAMGAIDAAAAIIISRRIDPAFDTSPIGLRRRRSIVGALQRLEAEPPALDARAGMAASLAVITAVVLADYLAFRFGDAPWMPEHPRLAALSAAARARPAFAATLPREMPPR